MCGITITWNLDRSFTEKMCEHQSSRGPDRIGIQEFGDKIIFGHSRLSIIDKSEKGNQPMCAIDQNGYEYWITYNGECFNYLDLPVLPKQSTDTATILRFICDGDLDKKLNQLNGMFSFGFFDPEDQTIFLVRDRFGIKPLYFYQGKDYFVAASTPAAISLTQTNWNRSEKGLQEYLSLGATMLHSIFDGIVAVPPGHYVTFNVKTQELKTKRWYYPKFIDNAYEKIEENVNEAIERVKLSCDWPQVILLSGGVDSSLVASHYQGREAIHLASPEQEYAQKVADKFGIQLHNVHPLNYNAEECLTDYITKSGDPTMAGLIPYITCKEISRLGHRVAITANGADELFFGYDRMKDDGEQIKHIFRNFGLQKICRYIDEVFDTQGLIDKGMNRNSIIEIFSYLAFDLNKTLDFASMCHSIEVRVPYLDHELVEAALSIPMEQHVAKYGNKTILKKMLLGLGFDFDFIHRPKVGFSLHHEPNDLQELKNKAMKWYKSTDYEQLSVNSTPRQEAYHQMTVVGLYLWSKIHNFA